MGAMFGKPTSNQSAPCLGLVQRLALDWILVLSVGSEPRVTFLAAAREHGPELSGPDNRDSKPT